jgi:hypothetical protein
MSQIQSIAILENTTVHSITSENMPREEKSSSTPQRIIRTPMNMEKSREERPFLTSTNQIPNHHAPAVKTVNSIECFLSSLLSDPSYKIHTITQAESDN